MYWLTLQKHLEHTANLLDDLNYSKESEYIREIVIPRMHDDSDTLQQNGKQALLNMIEGNGVKHQQFIQTLLDKERALKAKKRKD